VPTPSGLHRQNFIVGYKDEIGLKEARKRRLELLAKANSGLLHHSGGMTFAELVERFKELRLPSLKASTLGFYSQHLTHHLLPAFGELELEQVSRLRIEQIPSVEVGSGLENAERNPRDVVGGSQKCG
jgi:hypothetical protein